MARPWGTLSELVRRDRIRVAVAAWAYETGHRPIMTDRQYDQLSQRVHETRNVATGNHRLDRFFSRNFQADTGLWVHSHPDKAGLENIYARYYQKPKRRRKRKRR